MKKLMKYLVGDVEEKRAWRRTMKRVATLPADYRFVCKQMMRYGFNFGFSSEAQEHLIIFFEQSAAAGRRVQEVVGHDAAAFFDALIEVDSVPAEDRRQVLNREILEHFSKGGKTMFEWIKKIRESKREYRKIWRVRLHCPTIIALFMKKLSRISGALPEEQAWICSKRSMFSLNCLKKAQPKERMF